MVLMRVSDVSFLCCTENEIWPMNSGLGDVLGGKGQRRSRVKQSGVAVRVGAIEKLLLGRNVFEDSLRSNGRMGKCTLRKSSRRENCWTKLERGQYTPDVFTAVQLLPRRHFATLEQRKVKCYLH